MDNFTLVGLGAAGALLLGIFTGTIATLAFRYSERSKDKAVTKPALSGIDEGVIRVLSVLRSAAVIVAADGKLVRASAAAYSLGVVRAEKIAPPAINEMVTTVRKEGIILDKELEIQRGPVGHGTVLLSVRVAPLDTEHVLVLAEDRTEAARVEAIRRDFAVNVSHELKTPVGAITLLAETIADAADDPDAVRHFATRAQQEAARLGQLVHEIIELSRLQGAGALTNVTLVSIDEVIQEAVDRARVVASSREIRLSIGAKSDLAVYGDHALLVTAVRNLLDNAVAYSGPNTMVGVGVSQSDDLVKINVIDEGIGISPEQQDRIFERFYRVDPARSRDTGGTGLGLSIVKHVAADHGGDIQIWSQLGKGSTFTLRLPIAKGAPPALKPQQILRPDSTFASEVEKGIRSNGN